MDPPGDGWRLARDRRASRALRRQAAHGWYSMTSTGRAEQYRNRSPWERLAALRRGRSRPAPAFVKSVYEAILERWPGDHLVSRFPGGESVRVSARYRHLSWNPEEYQAFRA